MCLQCSTCHLCHSSQILQERHLGSYPSSKDLYIGPCEYPMTITLAMITHAQRAPNVQFIFNCNDKDSLHWSKCFSPFDSRDKVPRANSLFSYKEFTHVHGISPKPRWTAAWPHIIPRISPCPPRTTWYCLCGLQLLCSQLNYTLGLVEGCPNPWVHNSHIICMGHRH